MNALLIHRIVVTSDHDIAEMLLVEVIYTKDTHTYTLISEQRMYL